MTTYITQKLRLQVLERDEYTCQSCKTKPEPRFRHVHHIIPRKKGGKNTLDNLITKCQSCHISQEFEEKETNKVYTNGVKCKKCGVMKCIKTGKIGLKQRYACKSCFYYFLE